MVKKLYEEKHIQDLANIYRGKTGDAKKYKLADLVTAYDNMSIGIKPSGELEINENGKYDIAEFESVNVDVKSGFDEKEYYSDEFSNTSAANVSLYAKSIKKALPITLSDKTGTSSYVYYMSYAFANFSYLEDLSEIKNLDTRKCGPFSNCFYNCISLVDCELNWNMASAVTLVSMFNGCSKLERCVFTNTVSISRTLSTASMFNGCSLLKEITFNFGFATNNAGNMFTDCRSLELLDIRKCKFSSIVNTNYANCMTNVPTSVNIIVRDETEKQWWNTFHPTYENVFSVSEAIAEGIVSE